MKSVKSICKIQDMVSIVYGDKSLKKTAMYDILKKVKEGRNAADQKGINSPKRVCFAGIISSVSAAAAAYRRIAVRELASSHGLPIGSWNC
jgi:hypothetical protein